LDTVADKVKLTASGIKNFMGDLRALYIARNSGFLYEWGWWRSHKEQSAIDADGDPIPLLTYPCIEFLRGRIGKSLDVFEYGSGSSTLWWADRVRSVISCEHDRQWYDKAKQAIPGNVTLLFRELGSGEYAKEILNYEDRFDLIVIDGRDRVNCARNSLKALKNSGVIIWDDTERADYSAGINFLKTSGFRKVDFWGFGPISTLRSCSTIFYRDDNCLEL
jgi:Methyltransferase domain